MSEMSRLKVLVVDDDKEIVNATAIHLRNEGYQPLKAYDGLQALDILNTHEVHLIILDVMMPRMDGLSATLKIREERNIPIIILSAKSEDSDKILGLSMGADDYVTKPFSSKELMARVKSQLRRYLTLGDVIKDGDMETRLDVALDADIYEAAQNLNSIQEGISRAVSEKLRSERMKVDLITNVSHDLKTPLTSIVSYVELLAKEEGLPSHARDYVSILTQKTKRLKHLIQDLFDLAKATSNDLVLDVNQLDLVRLIDQALADMQEQSDDSGLAFRVNLPDEPIYVVSDGTKLSRVLQNLISNTLKYSLLGSRVFIDLVAEDGEALVTIKNTANYEMDFDEAEILERFVRGDRSRSTEGSGLGLSIAKSFTEACGGRFNIKIDGDQFKVELRFPQID